MLKKLIPTILLGIFLFQIVGFTIYFNIEKSAIKKQLKTYIKEGVPKTQLKKFEFTPKQYSNLLFTKKKEFKIKENYFDIVYSKKLPNGNLFLECVNDKQETILFKNLAENVNFNLSDQKPNSPLKIVFSILQLPFIESQTSYEIEINLISDIQKDFFIYLENKSQTEFQVQTPPPNFISFC